MEYLDATANSGRRVQLKKILIEKGFSESRLNELESINKDLGTFPATQPGESLNRSFYSMLKEHKQPAPAQENQWQYIFSNFKKIFEPHYVLRAAYSIMLIFTGWSIGFWSNAGDGQEKEIQYLSSEIHQMKKLVSFSILNQASPVQRLKNVNMISSFENMDDHVITMLINTLNKDANVNVRLSALEALFKLADNNRVREGLVHSLAKQESPLIQLALVDCYAALNETRAIGQLKQLLHNKEINDVVRSQVSQTLKILI